MKETLESFDGICKDFRTRLDTLIRTITKKKEEVILNKASKLNLEKKGKYKSLLTFCFNAFEDHFVNLRKSLEEKFRFSSKTLFKNLSDFQTNMLVELQMKNTKLKEELASTQLMRDQLRRKKEKYFDSIHLISLDRLTKLKNQRITGDKSFFLLGFAGLMSFEAKYFEHYIKINKQYSRINHTLKSLLTMYEENIQHKFSFIYFKVLEIDIKANGRLPNKYEDAMRRFKISFNEFRMDSYIMNFNTIYEIYFPLTKIIGYRSKLELL